MRRIGWVLLFVYLSTNLGAEETLPSDHPLEPRPGDYVIYFDRRDQTEALVGVFYRGSDGYRIRYNGTENSENDFLADIAVTLTPTSATSGEPLFVSGHSEPAIYEAVVADFLTSMNQYRRWRENGFPESRTRRMEDDTEWVFAFWVSLYGLVSVVNPEGTRVRRVLAFGNDETGEEFHSFTGYPTAGEGPSWNIVAREPSRENLGGLSVMVDENWERQDDDSWLVARVTERDAMLRGFRFAIGHDDPAVLYILASMNMKARSNLIPGGSVVLNAGEDFLMVSHAVYDTVSQTYSTVINVYWLLGGGEYALLSLSAFDTLFRDNRSYFIGMINSIRRETED